MMPRGRRRYEERSLIRLVKKDSVNPTLSELRMQRRFRISWTARALFRVSWIVSIGLHWPPLSAMRCGPLARGTCRIFAAAGLIIAVACSDFRDRRTPADDMVGLNNRGVGLMGQFDYDAARDIFVGLAAAHPDRLELQVNLAIATLNR